jgi:hypothetical protein
MTTPTRRARSFQSHVVAWLKDQYARTSIPVLVVAALTLTVSIATYWLQKSAYNRPELAASGGTIHVDSDPIIEDLDWTNIGRKPARNGVATLFSIGEDGASKQQLGKRQSLG